MTTAAHLSWPATGVALVTLDNPPRNFGTNELAGKILACVTEADKAGASVVVLASDLPGILSRTGRWRPWSMPTAGRRAGRRGPVHRVCSTCSRPCR